MCVFGGCKGDLCCHYRGSPAFLGQLNSSRWLHWPQLVALFPLHGPTHDRAVVTVMAILFLFLPLEAQNQRETSALLPCYREQGNGQAAEFGCSQPGPDRLRVTVSQRTGPIETGWYKPFILQMGKLRSLRVKDFPKGESGLLEPVSPGSQV